MSSDEQTFVGQQSATFTGITFGAALDQSDEDNADGNHSKLVHCFSIRDEVMYTLEHFLRLLRDREPKTV